MKPIKVNEDNPSSIPSAETGNVTLKAAPSFTPGPWAWRNIGGEWVLWGEHGHRPVVLDVSRGGTHKGLLRVRNERDIMIPFNPTHPDVRMIAAAPELYEALRVAEVLIARDIIRDDAGCLEKVRAALALVEGRQ